MNLQTTNALVEQGVSNCERNELFNLALADANAARAIQGHAPLSREEFSDQIRAFLKDAHEAAAKAAHTRLEKAGRWLWSRVDPANVPAILDGILRRFDGAVQSEKWEAEFKFHNECQSRKGEPALTQDEFRSFIFQMFGQFEILQRIDCGTRQ